MKPRRSIPAAAPRPTFISSTNFKLTTRGGHDNNIEAGALLNCDLKSASDKSIVEEIESLLTALPDEFPSHVVSAGWHSALDQMPGKGLLADEMALAPPKLTFSGSGSGSTDSVPGIKLKVGLLRRSPTRAERITAGSGATISKTNAPATAPPSPAVAVLLPTSLVAEETRDPASATARAVE